MSNITGDQATRIELPKRGVTFHNFPQAPLSELEDSTAIVNDFKQSGKRMGAQVMGVDSDGNAGIYCASGRTSADAWILVAQITGAEEEPTSLNPV